MFNFLYEKYADFKTEGWMKVSPCRLLNSDKNYSSFLKRGCCLTLNLWMILKHSMSSCLISPLYPLPTEHLLW